jgi:peptidoglycan/xylan/chitin deacetylase (PgdA/CDA1 family)
MVSVKSWVICSICLLQASQILSQRKQVCFSIDDLPTVTYGITDSVYQRQLAEKLLTALKKNGIPAIGFVNESKLYDRGNLIPARVGLLRRWIESDLELGNHTFSHWDYNSTSFKTFSQDVVRGELVTTRIVRKGAKLNYFRHPFLHVGNSREKFDSLNLFVLRRGYTVAPVTIDNEDYLFASAYKKAADRKDTRLMTQIGDDYISYMEKKVVYYERQTQILFGRNVKQILLIHASLLNADYLEFLARMFVKNGYDFVTMEAALKDDAYTTDISVYGNWGISWIDRWALSQGKKGAFFEGEPETPDYIKKIAE